MSKRSQPTIESRAQIPAIGANTKSDHLQTLKRYMPAAAVAVPPPPLSECCAARSLTTALASGGRSPTWHLSGSVWGDRRSPQHTAWQQSPHCASTPAQHSTSWHGIPVAPRHPLLALLSNAIPPLLSLSRGKGSHFETRLCISKRAAACCTPAFRPARACSWAWGTDTYRTGS